MNAPFQSVGIIFFVTVVHVIVIAVYSSRNSPESTTRRSVAVPESETLEAMPEQLIKEGLSPELAEAADFSIEIAEPEVTAPVIADEQPEPSKEKSSSTVLEVAEKVAKPEAPKEKKAERWEESDFAKRVSFPTLDGIITKKSKALAENKPVQPVSKPDRKDASGEPAPRVRSFSPIPKS